MPVYYVCGNDFSTQLDLPFLCKNAAVKVVVQRSSNVNCSDDIDKKAL